MKARIDAITAGKPLTQARNREAVELFRTHGALWIDRVLATEFVDELLQAYRERYLSLDRKTLRKRFAVVGDKRFMITLKIKSPFNSPALFASPVVMPLVESLLGEDCTISSFGSVVAFPGAEQQTVHFDYPPLYESEATCAALPPHAITLAVPLVDLTLETGSTAIWEGSHARVGAREQLRSLAETSTLEGASIPTPMKGGVFLMDFRVIHAGMPNLSDQPRPLLYIVYRRPWFNERDNFQEQSPLDLSEKQLRRIPKKHRHLFSAG